MPLPHRIPARILSKRRARSARTSRPLTLESLEARQLLAAHTLESVTGTIPAAVNATSSARLTLDSTGPAVLLGLRVVSTDSSTGFDPAAPLVRRSDQSVAAVESWLDVSATDSAGMTLVEFQRGLTYDILIGAEGATGGAYRLEVFLPGDLDGNGQVDTAEMQQATGAMVADQFGGNFVSSQFFRRSNNGNGTPAAVREALDWDQSGRVDIDEFTIVERQLGMPRLTLNLIQDGDAPAITLQRVNGANDRNPTDVVTNVTRITGTLSDISPIQSFEASIDNGPFVSLLGPGFFPTQDFRANPDFELVLNQLETIAGTGAGSLANTGEHILRVRATDQTGNTVRDPVELRFRFDTLAPDAPAAPTLKLGTPGIDTNIRTTTPMIVVLAETASHVELFLGTTRIGSGDVGAGGSVEIQTIALSAGPNSITARAIDAAGNTSVDSAALVITVDITAPTVSNLTLSPPTSLEDPEGHPLVDGPTVTLNGTTEPGATVELSVDDTPFGTQIASATGNFVFANVTLAFGKNVITQVITDAAGNTFNNNTTGQTITRDSAPTVATAMGQRTVDEDSGVFTIALNSVFADADLASGDVLTFTVQSNSSTSLASAVVEGSNLRVTPQSDQHGDATIVVHATDSFGRSVQDTLSLTVTSVPDPPVAGNDTADASISQGQLTLTSQLLSNDSDPDDGQLTIISVDTSSTLGAVELLNGVVTYNPLPAFENLGPTETAQDSFTYTVQDAEGATATATVNITVRGNDLPIARPDSFSTDEDTEKTGNVLVDNGNGADTDPDGDSGALTVVPITGLISAKGATVNINDDGSFSYDPSSSATLQALAAGATTTDTFNYTVRDAFTGSEGTVTVTVTGLDHAPIARADAVNTDEDTVLNGNLLQDNGNGADSDADGDALQVVVPIGGSLTTARGATVAINADGTFSYDPRNAAALQALAQGATISDTFSYTVSDGLLTSTTTVTVTVAGRNDAPVAQDDDFTTNADTNRAGNVFEDNGHGADADPDVPTPQLTVTNTGTRATSRGGSVMINADGSFTYNPTGSAELRAVVLGQSLVDTFEYTVSDGTASDTAIVRITVTGTNNAPTLAEIQDVILLAGAPLHIPLDGFDAESHTLTFSATSSNPSLVQTILSPNTNRSMRVEVANFGTMVFHLFEDLVPRVTSNIIGIANAGTYDGVIFHRIVKTDGQGNPFVIQGGDPNGNGQNDEMAPEFDDQFHVDLQHTSTGLLSMAKGGDDSNSSQFFITAPTTVTLRRLDFNHSVFGQLVEGESVRQAIQQVPTGANDRPTTDVVMQNVEIFLDQENGVLRLKAAEGASGQATITVTARDARGAEVTRTFQVTVQPDSFNGVPFLNDIPAITTTQDTDVSFEVSAQDAENSTVTFAHLTQGGTPLNGAKNPNLAFTVVRDDSFGDAFTTRFTVTPPTGFVGTLDLLVGVSSSGSDTVDNFDVQLVTITVNPTAAPLTLAPGSQSDAGLGSDGLAPTEVIASDDARVQAVLASAVSTWQEQLGTNLDLDIQVQVGQHVGDQLADATILDYDAAGRPSHGLITLDDDALGIGWHVDVNSQPSTGDLDLYTTLLHEVGHLLGFTAYYAPFAQHLTQLDGNTVFAADGVWAQLDDDGLHLDQQLHPNDLMNATLAPGQRRLPSALDVSILTAVYRTLESSQVAAADDVDVVDAIDHANSLETLDDWFASLPNA